MNPRNANWFSVMLHQSDLAPVKNIWLQYITLPVWKCIEKAIMRMITELMFMNRWLTWRYREIKDMYDQKRNWRLCDQNWKISKQCIGVQCCCLLELLCDLSLWSMVNRSLFQYFWYPYSSSSEQKIKVYWNNIILSCGLQLIFFICFCVYIYVCSSLFGLAWCCISHIWHLCNCWKK